MSDELQAEVAQLKALNEKLAKDLVDAHADLKEVRGEARDRRHENKSLAQQVADLTAERDTFKGQAETTAADWQAKIGDLTGQLRGIKHERAIADAARELKVTDPAKFADLIKVVGYTPESDEPDAEKIKGAFGEALKGRPWLLDAEPAPAAAAAATPAPGGAIVASTTPPPAVPGPGADRGQSVSAPPAQASSGKPQGAL